MNNKNTETALITLCTVCACACLLVLFWLCLLFQSESITCFCEIIYLIKYAKIAKFYYELMLTLACSFTCCLLTVYF